MSTKPSKRVVPVTAPVVETIGGEDVVTLYISGRRWTLSAPDDRSSRSSAVALHSAKSILLVVDEHPRFPFPVDSGQDGGTP